VADRSKRHGSLRFRLCLEDQNAENPKAANSKMNSTVDQLSSIRILETRVHIAHVSDVIKIMDRWIQSEPERLHHVINTGMHGIMEAHRDPQILDILNTADILAPDGILTVLVARLNGYKLRKKDTGPELLNKFCEIAEEKQYCFYFYGDTEETLDRLLNRVNSDFPNIKVVGSHSPPFRMVTIEEDEAIVEEINLAKPDVLWVGLGMPKQEQWIYEHRTSLSVPVAVGAGAAFKFMSGTVDRAPTKVQNLGLEWLWRLVQEPKRVWRRVFIDAPQFVFLAFLQYARLKKFN
jgi:N-acetylglucosaminyldiphosphoundecaprenol N-acetyl-beta-D-mannosaminyltransferase